jgi:hypothetical protein
VTADAPTAVAVDDDGDDELSAAVVKRQCESLTRTAAALRHRQQRQQARVLTSTPTEAAVPAADPAALALRSEGDALMSQGEFAAAAIRYGRAAGLAPEDRELQQLQREALAQGKALKKQQKKKGKGKKKQQQPRQQQQSEQQPALVSVPRPRRNLPTSLAEGNCRFDVRVTAAMARALAEELLAIPLPPPPHSTGEQQRPTTSVEGEDEEARVVRAGLEAYEITEEMKRMQLRSVCPPAAPSAESVCLSFFVSS